MKENLNLIPTGMIERRIYMIRGIKVMLDNDLAELYQVSTKALNQAVKRNIERFPSDFMIRLNNKEIAILNRSQIVTGSQKHRDPKYLPYTFTEQGVAMLSAVLKSERAVQMSIIIVRTFIKLREMLATHKNIIMEIEKMKKAQKNQGENINLVMRVINKLVSSPPGSSKEPIGFSDK